MRRSIKYGFSAAVLAGMVGGMVAWGDVDKSVTLEVDGQSRTIHTTAALVSDVLAGAGYHAGAHDIVAPALSSTVHNGSTIVYRRGRLLRLDVDGHDSDVWTTAATVAQALAQLGYSTSDFTSVSRAARLPLTPTDIALRVPKVVTLSYGGKTRTVTTTDATVGAVLADLDVAVGSQDELVPGASSPITEGEHIVLRAVKRATLVQTQTVPFTTTKKSNPSLTKGRTEIVTPGRDGIEKITYAVVYIDGKLVGKTKIKTELAQAPTAQVLAVGTKAPTLSTTTSPALAVSQAPSIASGSIATPDQAQAIAKSILASRGMDDAQFACLAHLWGKESAWRVQAGNSSGAYGIPQALPGSKMASAGADWQSDARTQILWGLSYIAERYGTPCDAWSAWQAHGGWY